MASSARPDEIIDSAIASLWSVVNRLCALPDHRAGGEYRVSIFGSARIQPETPRYQEIKELARRLAAGGCTIVTGGGPGLMQAANEGERLGDPQDLRKTIGVRIELPFEQGANPFVEECHDHQTFFSRLHHFVRLSDAFIVTPGGVGTTLESLMVWQLLQVRHLNDVPLVFLGPMWRGLVAWAREHMLGGATPLANPRDLDIPVCVDTVAEAAAVVERHREARRLRDAGGTGAAGHGG